MSNLQIVKYKLNKKKNFCHIVAVLSSPNNEDDKHMANFWRF